MILFEWFNGSDGCRLYAKKNARRFELCALRFIKFVADYMKISPLS